MLSKSCRRCTRPVRTPHGLSADRCCEAKEQRGSLPNLRSRPKKKPKKRHTTSTTSFYSSRMGKVRYLVRENSQAAHTDPSLLPAWTSQFERSNYLESSGMQPRCHVGAHNQPLYRKCHESAIAKQLSSKSRLHIESLFSFARFSETNKAWSSSEP